MENLALKDQREGLIPTTRTDWKSDSIARKAIKKRAIALLLDYEGSRHLLDKKVCSILFSTN